MLSKVRTPTKATCKGVVTSRKNGPSPYTFTHANQRNAWASLDWTSQIPLKVVFSSENN